MKTHKTQVAKAVLRRKTELEASSSLTSNYAPKLQSSKVQYGTETKVEIQINGTG